MSGAKILDLLKEFRQHHILEHYRSLPRPQKETMLRELVGVDLPLLFKLHGAWALQRESARPFRGLSPAPIFLLPRTHEEKRRREEARLLGESLIRQNRVAVLIVAGGQGTRLGFPGPKGALPISPVRRKPLFQLFAEAVRALSLKYEAAIPLLIMTSEENDPATREFFCAHHFFGLDPQEVFFFRQAMLPTITPAGRLLLREEGRLLLNPDGHGGSLKALGQSGLLKQLMARGFRELFYCQVDNPLARIADPLMIGLHAMTGAEISTKVVRRRDPDEKVGIYGQISGKEGILEYSDFPPEEYRSVDDRGNMRYWAGNIAIHTISLSFIQRLNQGAFLLPYHRAVKEVEALGSSSQRPESLPAWKFEMFIFDAIPLAQRTCCLEVAREEEFAPVKNQEGKDSPETSREAMNRLFRSWLLEAGAQIAPEAGVEVSPLFALDREELVRKLKGKDLVIRENLYLEQGHGMPCRT